MLSDTQPFGVYCLQQWFSKSYSQYIIYMCLEMSLILFRCKLVECRIILCFLYSQGLADNTVIAKVNNNVWDLDRPLEEDCSLQLLKFDDEEAQAVSQHHLRSSPMFTICPYNCLWSRRRKCSSFKLHLTPQFAHFWNGYNCTEHLKWSNLWYLMQCLKTTQQILCLLSSYLLWANTPVQQ